ncbi:MAG: hypothetical protein V2I26_10080, partial [Halieaceae bacterium]|nr:hypothetical protein [Halieaceae bacterium]
MDQLEFALVPIGIVLGYGVTKIMVAWADVIHSWPHIRRPPLIYLSSTAMCLYFMYMNFAGLWAYKGVDFVLDNGIFNVVYLFAITLPMLIFMLAVSVLVPVATRQTLQFDAHYFQSSPSFYLILALGVCTTVLPDLLPGVEFAPSPTWPLIIAATFVCLAFVRNRFAHGLAHSLFWSLLAVGFGYTMFG